MPDGLRWYDPDQQLAEVSASLHDTRPSIPTGVGALDALLRRGGLLPGSFTIFGGRTGTRKTTTVLNMLVSMAKADVTVGFVGLDEPPWVYVLKFLSVWTGLSQDWLEYHWDDDAKAMRREWRDFARNRVHIFGGRRPSLDHIKAQVEMVAMGPEGRPPSIVVLDYLNLMTRDKQYGWKETERIPRIAEDLAVWSTETGIAVLALHQLSRNDEYGNSNNRNAGHLPLTLSQLKYGGEEPADMVLGTYRPTMNPLANMSMAVAKQVLGDRFDEDEFWELRKYAEKMRDSTFLQLLKNRPGTHREEHGIELVSPDESLRMTEKEAPDPDWREEEERDGEAARLD